MGSVRHSDGRFVCALEALNLQSEVFDALSHKIRRIATRTFTC